MSQRDFNDPNFYHHPKNRSKWRMFGFGLVIIIGLMGLNLSRIEHSVSVENKNWWKTIGGIFGVSVAEVGKKDLEAELNRQWPTPPKEADRQDILILGIRGQDDPDGGLLSDSIILLSFDKETERTTMVSLPRDLYMEMPGLLKGKINEIYEVGLTQRNPLDFTKKVFSRLSGVFIDNIVVFDFQSFQAIIDTVGGVDLNLKKPFEEKTQWGYTFSLPAGLNHFNGSTALYYVRSRYSSSDFDRARRQQEVILAIKKKVLSLELLKNPSQIISLAGHFKNNISTDLDLWDAKAIFNLSAALDSAALNTEILSTDNLLFQEIRDGIYILLPQNNDWPAFRGFFQNIFTSHSSR